MLGEVYKRQDNIPQAICHYLKGLQAEPLGNMENYYDLAELYQSLNINPMYLIIILYAKILTAINEGNLLPQDHQDTERLLTVNHPKVDS